MCSDKQPDDNYLAHGASGFYFQICFIYDNISYRKQSSSSFSSCSTSSELPGPASASVKSLRSSSISLASPRRLTSASGQGPGAPEVKNRLSAREKRQSHLADIQSDGGESDQEEVSDAETEIVGTTGSRKPVPEVTRRVTSAGSTRGGQPVTR